MTTLIGYIYNLMQKTNIAMPRLVEASLATAGFHCLLLWIPSLPLSSPPRPILTVEECNILTVAIIGARHVSWRIVSSIEESKGNEAQVNETQVSMLKG